MPRFTYLLVLLLAFSSLSMITYEQGILLRVEEVVQRWDSQVTYEYVGDGWVEFTDLEGRTFQKYVPTSTAARGLEPKKIITIHVPSIDTTGFGTMFTKIATAPIGTGAQGVVGYAFEDTLRCLIGHQLIDQHFPGTYIFQFKSTADAMERIYQFNYDAFVPFGFGNFLEKEYPHMAAESIEGISIFRTPATETFPIVKLATRTGESGAAQLPRIFDMDSDGMTEIVSGFYSDNPDVFRVTAILKYNEERDTLEAVSQIGFGGRMAYGSWAVGDFDMDGQGEYALVTFGGVVFFVENNKETGQYEVIFNDTTRTNNGGYNSEGNDIDSDGRPEVFLGSDQFGGLNNIAVYETTGNNDYEVSAWIEIIGTGALNREITTSDVDGDGIDELVLVDGGILLVLKSTGIDEYEVFWMKTFQSEIKVSHFDLDGNGIDDLLVSQSSPEWNGYTEVYSFNKLSSVESMQNPGDFRITGLYPNPARDHTTVDIHTEKPGNYTLTIYNYLGNQVQMLAVDLSTTGYASISIPTQGLENGMYYYRVANKYQQRSGKFVVMR